MNTEDILLLSGITSFWGLIILGGLLGGSEKSTIRRAQTEGRYRLIEIDGKKFHAIRKTETILRSKSGRSRAVLVAVGRERDPDMIDGKIQMLPRWIKIRSITSQGLSDRERWVDARGWSHEGEQEIEHLIALK